FAVGIDRHHLAIIAAGDDALAVRNRAEDAAAMHGDARDVAFRIHERDIFLGADKAGTLAEKMHGRRRRANRNGAHAVGDGCDGGLPAARLERAHHVVMQLSKPSRIACSGNSRPMKTSRLSRGSPSFHLRWWSPSSIMCTPWKT